MRVAPSSRADGIDARIDLLRPTLELAFEVARRDAVTRDAPTPPRPLHPFLRFDRLSQRVFGVVFEVLETDEAFRRRVSDASDRVDGSVPPASDEDPAGWWFLVRPDGWEVVFEELVASHAADLADDEAAQQHDDALDRLQRAEAALSAARDDLDAAQQRAESLSAELDAERAHRRALESELDRERRRATAAEDDRTRAVRDLSEARRLADRRLEALRAAEGADATNDTPVGAATIERARLEAAAASSRDAALDALRSVARVAGEVTVQLAAALDAAFDQLEVDVDDGQSAGVSHADDNGPRRITDGRTVPRARRVPVRLQRGAVDGTRAATMQLLGLDDVVVLVDGWNVSMTGWRQLSKAEQRDTLVTALGDLSARTGANFRVVFDGEDSGGRPAVAAPLPVRVYFTAASEEADDAILRMVTEVPLEQPVVVVSSDERVRTGARDRGANLVASADLIDALRH